MIEPTVLARIFRGVAIAEACSWTGLLIGMVVKYLVVFDEIGVQVFGPIHGALFVAYVIVTLLAARTFRWDLRTTATGLVAGIPPLATIWFERRVARRGHLEPVAVRLASADQVDRGPEPHRVDP